MNSLTKCFTIPYRILHTSLLEKCQHLAYPMLNKTKSLIAITVFSPEIPTKGLGFNRLKEKKLLKSHQKKKKVKRTQKTKKLRTLIRAKRKKWEFLKKNWLKLIDFALLYWRLRMSANCVHKGLSKWHLNISWSVTRHSRD